MKKLSYVLLLLLLLNKVNYAQTPKWIKNQDAFWQLDDSNTISKIELLSFTKTIVVTKQQLTNTNGKTLAISSFAFSDDATQVLIFTNTKKVWRLNTRGDYWLLNLKTNSLKQLGASLPASSLMFAKFSPDATKVAYVSNYNLYVEDVTTNNIQQLTTDGSRHHINGTFDWAYEEEFFCRDGFRWSPDSKKIAYWQINANDTKDYLMLDNTDSIYPFVKPVEYPIAGEAPSAFKIGVVSITGGNTTWMQIPTDSILQSYVPRMEWAANNNELIVQHLNRKQNESELLLCNAINGGVKTIYHETDSAWIDILPLWDQDYINGGWDWLNNGNSFLWATEKDGWRHLYNVTRDGKKETLITKGDYDVMGISTIDEKSGYVYFFASPGNATQKYLYRARLDGSKVAELLSPADEAGTHNYEISPTGKYAWHDFSNYYTPHIKEWITLPDHKTISAISTDKSIKPADELKKNIRFFTVTTSEHITMDAWMQLPENFDSTKKYPVVFFVYTEPWGQNVKDVYGVTNNGLYKGDMAKDDYIYISIDNRGTPVPKGRTWRKSVYKKIGLVNIRDQALAATEILKWRYIDTSRVAVWGWSGGGSATLNLMFQYPQIYKTGIAIAAVGNQLTYDNIYQERYMGLPQENKQDFINGSPITYAKNLQGNLLYIHGTGDDNVHYNNAEMLINELVKYNKPFQLMSYPNRTHSISEGEGTTEHLKNLYTQYLHEHCPGGAR